jgi:hypothetical protein
VQIVQFGNGIGALRADRGIARAACHGSAVASRLNLLRALPDHAAEPSVQPAVNRFLTHVTAAIERLKHLAGPSS